MQKVNTLVKGLFGRMDVLKRAASEYCSQDEGQGIAEYALIVGVVVVVAAVAVLAFGERISDLFGAANTALASGLV